MGRASTMGPDGPEVDERASPSSARYSGSPGTVGSPPTDAICAADKGAMACRRLERLKR